MTGPGAGPDRWRRVSTGQERTWFLAQLRPDLPLHNIARTVRILGCASPEVVERAVAVVMARHEVLRTALAVHDGTVAGRVAESTAVGVRHTDLTRLPASAREPEFERIAAADAAVPFALDRPPLLRVRRVRLGPDDQRLGYVVHAAVADVASAAAIGAELAGCVAALAAGQAPPGDPAPG